MTTSELNTIYNEFITNQRDSTQMKLINSVFYEGAIFSWNPDPKEYTKRYELGSKQVNKLKRLDPNKKIVDAHDIDWYGYNIVFDGKVFQPKTTEEMLSIIFGLLGKLFNIYSDFDIIWNDNGKNRINENILNWASDYVRDENNEPIRYKVDSNGNFIVDENGNLIVVTDEETPYRYLPAYKDDNGNIVKEISTVLFNTDTRELYDTNK